MATTADTRPAERTDSGIPTGKQLRDPDFAAFAVLWLGFVIAPVVAGFDKFFNWMVDWDQYLWSGFDGFPGTPAQFMIGVGIVEIAAGVLVLIAPRVGAPVVAAWLAGIIANLVMAGLETGMYWDIALRDVGLFLGAVALSLLARKHAPRWARPKEIDLT